MAKKATRRRTTSSKATSRTGRSKRKTGSGGSRTKSAAKATRTKSAGRTSAKGKPATRTTANRTTTTKSAAKKKTANTATKTKTTARQRSSGHAAARRTATTKTTSKRETAASKGATSKTKVTKKKQTNKATAKKTSTRKGDTSHPGSPSGPRERAAASDGASAPTSSKPKKSPFTRSQLNPLRKALYELRARIGRDLNLMSDEALRAADPEVDADDVADFGSDAFERTMTLGLMENESKTLQKIDVALEAMEAGTYGLCAECNEAIPLARLQALPFAEFCVPCQEQQERWG